MSIKCYDLLEVRVLNESVMARPIAWSAEDVDGQGHDSKGNDVEVAMYHTTCPHCAGLIEFYAADLYLALDGSEKNLKCLSCKRGKEPAPLPTVAPVDAPRIPPAGVVLIDPLYYRLMGMEDIYWELLERLDGNPYLASR